MIIDSFSPECKRLPALVHATIFVVCLVTSIGVNAQSPNRPGLPAAPAIISLLLDQTDSTVIDPVPPGVTASLRSLTRVEGVSPETFYFSAQESTCSDCGDVFGLDTQLATAYSRLAYHFDFDDSDSGEFATTGNSRNRQVSSAPRAIHTFECSGEDDPNWNGVNQRCEFMVGLRVQSQDGRFDDDFVQINVQPLFGVGGYYSDNDITCVSSTSDFSWCPHSVGARQVNDIPSIGNWDGQLVLVDSDGGSYSDICMGADEQNGAAIAINHILGNGDRPFVSRSSLSARPGQNCNTNFRSDEDIAELSDNHPERDASGNLIDGYGFNQKVVGFQIGSVQNGSSFALIQYHDVDMDFSSLGTSSGQFTMVSSADDCQDNQNLSCDNVPYPAYLFLTDSVIASRADLLASVVNVGCFNGCGAVNFGLAGVEIDRAVEHNLRMQGAWGLVLSNNWVRGNHLGGRGPKARVTIRAISTGAAHSITKNPELIRTPENQTGTEYLRGTSFASDWYNRYNVGIDNRINQESHDQGHDSAGWFRISGNYSVEQGTVYIDDDETLFNGQSSVQLGRYRVIRDITWSNEGASGDGDYVPDCGLITTAYDDGTVYNDSRQVYFESASCNTVNNFNVGLPVLPIPNAPVR